MAGSLIAFNTLDRANLLSDDEKTQFHTGNANQRNAIVTSAMPRVAQLFQTAKEKQAAELNAAHTQLMGAQYDQIRDNMKGDPFAHTKIYSTGPDGQQQIEMGEYGPNGQPHYYPGSQNPGQMFQPDEQTRKVMQDSGYTWGQQSNRAGRWINTNANKPDLASDGNPMFTPDGTGFVSHGQVKPITDAMRSQRMIYQSQQPQSGPAPASPSTPPLQPDPGIMQNPFGSTPPATPSPSPTATSKVRVKRPDGQVGLIPAEQLQSALAAGYSQVQ